MNSVELQIKRNLENDPMYKCIKKNKIPRNKSNQEGKTAVLGKL